MKIVLDDNKKAAAQIDDLFHEDMSNKEGMYSIWGESINFLNGEQSIRYTRDRLRNNDVGFDGSTDRRSRVYITNEIEPIVRTLASFLTRTKPISSVYPTDVTSDEAVRRARMAELILKSRWEIDDEQYRNYMCAYWLLTTGNVFRKDFWDTSARPKVYNPAIVQMQSQVFQAQLNGESEAETDQALLNMPPPAFWGDNGIAILNPYQMAVDFNCKEFNEASWVMEYSLQDVDWVKTQYNQMEPGYTRLINQVQPQEEFGKALEQDLNLRFSNARGGVKKPTPLNQCVLKELYQLPDYRFPWNTNTTEPPRGRMIVATKEVVLYDGPSPYDWHPYSYARYEPYIGRFWGKSLVEQIVAPQRRLNEINGAILENSQTMANPQWLVPEGSIKPGILSGKHGLVVNWQPNASGFEPKRLDGQPLPTQYFNERQLLIDTMVRIAGSNAIMQGTPPTGVTAAAALQMLLENANNQHGPLINMFEKFIEQCQNKKIENFIKFNQEPRRDLMQQLKKLKEDLNDLDVSSITGKDIQDSVNVQIETGSSIPRSESGKISMLMQLGAAGNLGDIVNDPILSVQYLKKLGVEPFNNKLDAEFEKIQWENGRMLKGLTPSPSEFDNHALHIPEHIAETQRPSFIEYKDQNVKSLFFEHIAWHQEQMTAAAEAEKAEQAEMMNMQIDAQTAAEASKEVLKSNLKTKEEIIKGQLKPPKLEGASKNLPMQ